MDSYRVVAWTDREIQPKIPLCSSNHARHFGSWPWAGCRSQVSVQIPVNARVIFSVLLGQKCTRLEKNFCLVSISTAGCARHLGIEPNHKVLRPKVLNHNPPATARQLIFPSCYVPQLVLCANGHAKLYCLPIAIIIAKCSLKPHSSTKLFCHGASGSKHPSSRHQDVQN